MILSTYIYKSAKECWRRLEILKQVFMDNLTFSILAWPEAALADFWYKLILLMK